MTKETLDLRGLSCPQPVFETKKAIEDPSFGSVSVIVDTKTSLENIKRLLAGRKDLQYSVEEKEDYTVNISKAGS
jgi:TusA-related sulfurtransferase